MDDEEAPEDVDYPPTSHLLAPSLDDGDGPKRWRSSDRRASAAMKRYCLRVVKVAALVLFGAAAVSALPSFLSSGDRRDSTDPFALHDIESPDGSIKASFIALGATIQSLYVKDRYGKHRDVVLGYDDTGKYMTDPNHPYFGAVVGRYANRIKNAAFTIPPTRDVRSDARGVYHTTANEHNGRNTLHGGTPGWDRRPFTLIEKTSNSVTFALTDPADDQGFPHAVHGKVEYRLENDGKWLQTMTATADGLTPIMLSSHVYWNLDGYQDEASAAEHDLYIGASRYVKTDGLLIPTGEWGDVTGTAYDFRRARTVASELDKTLGYCGPGCLGYDTAYVYDEHSFDEPVVQMSSRKSGIQLTVRTDQTSLQLYSCNGIVNANTSIPPIPRKASQGGPGKVYQDHSCVVLEQQQPIDAVNNPQWGIDVIHGPDRPYEWRSLYQLTTL